MALQPEQSVTLHFGAASGREPIDATVEEASDRQVRLAIEDPAAVLDARSLSSEPAVLEYTTSRGIHRVSGRVDGTGPDAGILLLQRDHDADDDIVQRRDFARVAAAVPVQVTITGPMRGAITTTTLNLSAGGVLFVDPIGMPAGGRVNLDIELAAGSAPVKAEGEIVREFGEEAKGVRIVSISAGDRERLVRFVTEQQRVAVRIARG